MDAKLESDPYKLFPGKSIVVMGHLFSEAERYVYYSANRFIKKEEDNWAIWISTDTPYGKIKEKFKEYGFLLEQQEAHPIAELPDEANKNILFLDMISHRAGVSRKKHDDCRYLQDPSNLTELSLAINEVLAKRKCGLIILDSLNSLLVYNDLTKTLQFLRFLSAAVYEKKMTLVVYFVLGEQDPKIETSIKMAADASIIFDSDHMSIQFGSSQKAFRFEFSGEELKLFNP
ncbi:MAG: hypothetical protein ABIG39_02145 [Candidatus Micrarchaeota archaeon]